MSVSSVLASQGRVVTIESAAAVTSSTSGVASACARSVSHSTHTVSERLHRHRRPEIRPRREHEIEAVDGRAAFLEMALVPAREIAAGVVLQQREAVPQRRREQHQHRRGRGGEAELHLGLGGGLSHGANSTRLANSVIIVARMSEANPGPVRTSRISLTLNPGYDRSRRTEPCSSPSSMS